MASMRIEDAFAGPGGRTVVTGRLHGGDVQLGTRLWLVGGAARHAVLVTGFLRVCGRHDATLARAGENTAMILDGVPPGVALTGLVLDTGE
ncbi:hypothetical protein OHA72_42770 [Dactylosporangium sp. NBC_01737]|uniref:hypothetical protein n=1 Tax=Dactylosporangium sp. NBC_01737 TaxID=2975959 RepID=UPI002E0E20BE|nr:hypothetical protein OHA72_42770 [Dactylosporangium sp. NBC_01737]